MAGASGVYQLVLMRSLREFVELFPNCRAAGLTDAEAGESRAKSGANRLTPLPREPAWRKFLKQFNQPIIKILLAASLLKIVVDLFETSHLDGALALVSVLLLFVVGLAVRIHDWAPAIVFGLAMVWVIVSVAIGDPSYEGLAVMVAVIL